MAYTICKSFTFAASHKLNLGERSVHKCSRMHGHTYRVDVILSSSKLNEYGMVEDFCDLDDVKHRIEAYYDHRDLTEIMVQSTSENIAKELFDWTKKRHAKLKAVKVWESPNSWAEYGATK